MLSLVQTNPPQDLGLPLELVKSDGRPIWNSSKSAKARWIDDDDDNNDTDDDDGDDDSKNADFRLRFCKVEVMIMESA